MLIRYMAYDAALDFVEEIVSVEETFVSGSWASNEKFSPAFSGLLKALPVVEHKGGSSIKPAPVLSTSLRWRDSCLRRPQIAQKQS